MRKLLNTLYVTREEGYLSLDGENVVLTEGREELVRLPFTNLESIICFNYPGCSPALMGKCAKENIGLCFLSPSGRFLARVTGETKGNVFLRKQQLEKFGDAEVQVGLIRTILSAKLKNTRSLLLRSRRDHPETDADDALTHCAELLSANLERIAGEKEPDVLRGLEGESAKAYFSVFDRLFVQQRETFVCLQGRSGLRSTERMPCCPFFTRCVRTILLLHWNVWGSILISVYFIRSVPEGLRWRPISWKNFVLPSSVSSSVQSI